MENSSLDKKLHQKGSGRINPRFSNELQNLSFQINGHILDNQVIAVIQKLVNDFDKMAANDLDVGMELSHSYAADKKLLSDKGVTVCENCEIVLKYVDTAVCLTDSSAVRKFQTTNEKTVHVTKEGKDVECRLSRGLVKFYLKTINGDSATYSKIKVVKIVPASQVDCKYALYQNNAEIEKLNKTTIAAIAHSQTEALAKSKLVQELNMISQATLTAAAEEVKKIEDKSKKALSQIQQKIEGVISQKGGDGETKILSETPPQETVDAAAVVASATDKNIVLVPDAAPTVLPSGASIPTDASVVAVTPESKNNILGALFGTLSGAVKTVSGKIVNLFPVSEKVSVATTATDATAVPKPTVTPQPTSEEITKNLEKQITAAARKAHGEVSEKLGLTSEQAAKELEKSLDAAKKEYSERRKSLEQKASETKAKVGQTISESKAKARQLTAQTRANVSEQSKSLASE